MMQPDDQDVSLSRHRNRSSQLISTLIDSWKRRRPGELSPRTQRLVLVIAAVGFVVGGILAARSIDLDFRTLRWAPLGLLALGGVPLSIYTTALEFRLSARVLGLHVERPAALRVTVAANAANLLPLPGAALLRIQALNSLGPRYRNATASTALVGVIWLGVSAGIAGVFLIRLDSPAAGWLFSVSAVIVLLLGFMLLRRQQSDWRRFRSLGGQIVLVEAASILVGAIRLHLALQAIGVQPTISQTLVLAVSGVLASSVGIFPGGLGLREFLAGVLSPLVGLSVGVGFLAAGVNRLVGMAVHLPLALVLSRASGRQDSSSSEGQ